jgi:hypothetical protein
MNTTKGKDLVTLAKELQRVQEVAKDYMVPTSKLGMTDDGAITFTNGHEHKYQPTRWAHGQLMNYVDVPTKYAERLRDENPKLLAQNFNHGIARVLATTKDPQKESRFVRVLDGKMRAMLSSRFLDFSTYELANIVVPMAMEKGLQFLTGESTEKRTYMRFLSPRLTAEVKRGDVVQYGFQVSTSDVGAGAINFEGFFHRLSCLNGAISINTFRRLHVGKNQATGNIEELLSSSTKNHMKNALQGQIKDVILNGLSEDVFQGEIEKMQQAAGREIANKNPLEVIEYAMESVGLTGKDTANNIIAALATGNEGAGYTQWGLVNAFTRVGRDEKDFDKAVEFERAGAAILNLNPSQWNRIAA